MTVLERRAWLAMLATALLASSTVVAAEKALYLVDCQPLQLVTKQTQRRFD